MTRTWLFIIIMIVLAAVLACGPSQKDLAQQAEAAQVQKARTLLSSMIARHKASLDWDKQVKERPFAFSIDIQEAIAAQTARPLVVLGSLDDIYSRDGKAYAIVKYASSSVEVLFVLETRDDLRRAISSLESPKYGRFAFVVSPASSSLPLLKALADPQEEVLIEPADTLVVRGNLIDFVWLSGLTAEQIAPSSPEV